MPLEDAYFISQIVAAIAIVASLIFVGLQLRQSAKMQYAVIEQGRADRTMAAFATWLEPHNAALIDRLMKDDLNLTSGEVLRAHFVFRSVLVHFEETMLQQKAGLLHEMAWTTTQAAMKFYLQNPGFQALWEMLRPTYSAELKTAIEPLIDRSTSPPPLPSATQPTITSSSSGCWRCKWL